MPKGWTRPPSTFVSVAADDRAEPATQEAQDDAEELIWRETLRPRGCRIYLFGLVPLNREPRLTLEVDVTIRNGRVYQAVERRRDRNGAASERDLLDPTKTGAAEG